ncbi:RidA family protein [Niveispirillum sp.]|uniref:RidA family protein n=1 Tax=Niveispirillum sp. TaxID=1917217 RepID=UPI0025F10AE1|nr:RidA family protein [Niveispirillum sp.]
MSVAPALSPAMIAGDLIFLSGQLAFGDEGVIVAPDDVARQTEQVLANLARVLTGHGLDLSDIVKTTIWLTDTADFPAFNAAYARAFGAHRPARSTVRSDLVLPGARVEIEAVAKRR